MSAAKDILDELRNMNSLLADMPRTTPYEVPAGYFKELAGYTRDTIKAIEGDEIITQGWVKKMPFEVPADYFGDLSTELLATIRSEQQPGLPKSQPYAVPAGYFETLPQQILQAAKANNNTAAKTSRTIRLGGRINNAIRWAAAAVLLLGIGFTSYNILWKHNDSFNAEKALAQVPDDVINDYVQQHIDDFDMEQLENTIAANKSIDPFNTDIVSDEEIILYLDETGWDQTEVN